MQPARGDVGHGGAGQRRPAVGGALGHVQVAAGRQVVEVVAGPGGGGPGLPVAAGRAVHDRRVHRPHRVVADAEAVDDAGPEALDHHVGAGRQAEEGVAPGGRP